MDKVKSLFLEVIKPELKALVEEAVLAALQKERKPKYPERVNVDQASEIIGYTKNSLYQMHSHGRIPCAIKVGVKLMLKTKELQEWVEQGGTQ